MSLDKLIGIFDNPIYSKLALENKNKFKIADPFPHIYFDNFLPEECAEIISDSIPSPFDKSFEWISRDKKNQVKQKMQFDEIKLPKIIRTILREFNSKQFLLFLETLTGIENLIPDPYFIGGGIHVASRGDFLKVHADHNWHFKLYTHRRVNALLYLTQKDWDESWGGELELWNSSMTKSTTTISSIFNRMVIFETTDKTYHGRPKPLACPPDKFRKALNLYFYTSKNESEISDPHFTIYKTENSPYDVKNTENYRNQRKNK